MTIRRLDENSWDHPNLSIPLLTPLRDWLFVRKCCRKQIRDSDGNIVLYLPDKDSENITWAEVMEIGPDVPPEYQIWLGSLVYIETISNTGMVEEFPGDETAQWYFVRLDACLMVAND